MMHERSVPPLTIEWVAGPGEAWRTTISAMGEPRAWRSVSVLSLIIALAAGVLTGSTGSPWSMAVVVAAVTFVGYLAVIQALIMLSVYLRNRKICVPGRRWASGADEHVLRVDTPDRTMLLDRVAIRTATRSGSVVVLRLRTGEATAVPAPLLPVEMLGR